MILDERAGGIEYVEVDAVIDAAVVCMLLVDIETEVGVVERLVLTTAVLGNGTLVVRVLLDTGVAAVVGIWLVARSVLDATEATDAVVDWSKDVLCGESIHVSDGSFHEVKASYQ